MRSLGIQEFFFLRFDIYCIKYTLLYVQYSTSSMSHLLLEENNIFGNFEYWKKKYTSNLRFALIFQFGKKNVGGEGGEMARPKFEKVIRFIR